MVKKTNNFIREKDKVFRCYNEIITDEQKKRYEKHPHAKEHFRFRKAYRGWKWFKSINTISTENSRIKRDSKNKFMKYYDNTVYDD